MTGGLALHSNPGEGLAGRGDWCLGVVVELVWVVWVVGDVGGGSQACLFSCVMWEQMKKCWNCCYFCYSFHH